MGSYCEGGTEKRDCPVHTSGPLRATKIDHCICKRGYFGTDPRQCNLCPANSFCPGGDVVTSCPERAAAERGAGVCTCKPGYYGDNPYRCSRCRKNSYCPGGTIVMSCPKFSVSNDRGRSVEDCKCVPGYYRVKDDQVIRPLSAAPPSSIIVSAMLRALTEVMAGLEQGVTSCAPCPAGSYCPGDSEIKRCPDLMTSNTGAKSGAQCGCQSGYFDKGRMPDANFAWKYTGTLEIKTAGSYTICSTSDDGSDVWVDGERKYTPAIHTL